MFYALKHRNYRIYFIGQFISLSGTWVQQIALSWLVYRMTSSVFLLGLVSFSGQIVTFLLASFAGVIADRHHRHHLLLIAQIAGMVQALVLTVLVLTDTITVWQIVALSLFSGLINAVDLPVRQAFTVDMIDKREDLSNAIALNSTMVNSARLAGPAIGGVLIGTVGEGVCFLINALSYAAVIVSLLAMRIKALPVHQKAKPMWQALKEGYHYTFGSIPIRIFLMLMGIGGFIGGGAQVLMPVFAKDVFHGGAQMLGFLMASSGFGALAGAIYLASRKTVLGLGKVILVAAILFSVGIFGFSLTQLAWPAMAFLFLSGFGLMVQMAATNTVLQTLVDENMRGRVMSFYTMSFMGTTPFGSLLAGSLAHRYGAPAVLFWGGIFAFVGAIIFALQLPRLRALVRPVYIQKGVLTEIVP